MQLTLFSTIVEAYIQNPDTELSNADLYNYVAHKHSLDASAFSPEPVGRSAAPTSLLKRKIRWYQQTLKQAGVIKRNEKERGLWGLVTQSTDSELSEIQKGKSLLGFSTELGIAVIAHCESFFSHIADPIHLVITSPPYPLARPRKYGNPSEKDYIDWLCRTLEPVIKLLAPGGSICLNVGNDIFIRGSPARSFYRERLVLSLHERFGLYKMDELIWVSNKPPGPIQWASKHRCQLNTGYEPIYWLTNDPTLVRSNNQRVLLPHTEKHLAFVRSGGTKHSAKQSDGAYMHRQGAFSNETKGRIPRNVLPFYSSKDDMNSAYRSYCEQNDYVRHGATMPVALPKFLIEFLTEENDLVVDPMAGRLKVGMAAEMLRRRWICTDKIVDYVMGSEVCFS